MRIVDKKLCETYSKMPCLVCGGNNLVSGHHLRSRGSGGPDIKENLLPLCFNHHAEVHNIGLKSFCFKYSQVKWQILSMGWKYCSLRERFWSDNVYSNDSNCSEIIS